MINCAECHSDFRSKVNRRNTSFSTYVNTAGIDRYFKEAGDIWLRNTVFGAEKTSEARELLRPLEIKNKELVLACFEDYYTAKIPEDYYRSLNYSVLASKEGCEECGKTLIPKVVQSDDLQESLKDPFRKPSYEYEAILVDEAGVDIILYTNNEFKVDSVKANYFKKLEHIACPSLIKEGGFYIGPDGSKIDTDVHFELGIDAYNDISDIAVLLFLRDVSDNIELDTQLKKISVKYKLTNIK